jgi:hypothetical protein
MKRTARGFRIYTEFSDTYGNIVTVQQSSSVKHRCWISVDSAVPAAHLSVVHAKRLIKALTRFVEDA